MKNKIYIFSLKQDQIDTRLAEEFYEILFVEGELEDFAFYTSQAILIFDPEGKYLGQTFPYYREVLVIRENHLETINTGNDFLKYLDINVGRKRLVNPKQFELIIGSVVKSKVEPHLGPGYVVSKDDDQVVVNFPKAIDILGKERIVCHQSILRVITHIKELAY